MPLLIFLLQNLVGKQAFPWTEHFSKPKTVRVCDIGAGNGHVMLALMKTYASYGFKAVIQDRPAFIELSKQVIRDVLSDVHIADTSLAMVQRESSGVERWTRRIRVNGFLQGFSGGWMRYLLCMSLRDSLEITLSDFRACEFSSAIVCELNRCTGD